jgi:hypothetical protein
MMTASLASIPYSERRLITIADPNAAKTSASSASDKTPLERVARAAVGGSTLGLSGVVVAGLVMAVVELSRSPGSPRAATPPPVLVVSREHAAGLTLPPGHPRDKVVYAAHPLDAHIYIPTFDFHRFLFEHKVSEAMRLLRSLGANTISVDRIEGWDRSVGVSVGAPVPSTPGATARANAKRKKTTSSSVMSRMKLSPTGPPVMPSDLVWTYHEPLWQEVASARMESGLTEFSLDVKSTDDFGVNAEVKVAIEKVGLNLGGDYKNHESTFWRLEGKFAKIA